MLYSCGAAAPRLDWTWTDKNKLIHLICEEGAQGGRRGEGGRKILEEFQEITLLKWMEWTNGMDWPEWTKGGGGESTDLSGNNRSMDHSGRQHRNGMDDGRWNGMNGLNGMDRMEWSIFNGSTNKWSYRTGIMSTGSMEHSRKWWTDC